MPHLFRGIAALIICATASSAAAGSAAIAPTRSIQRIVDDTVKPLMAKNRVPGMAIGVTTGGKTYVFDYGIASIESRRPVGPETLFEIGSISKTFTATLASWAQITNRLSLSDRTAKYLPALQGSKFGNVTLLELGTHTPGGLPLQVPDDVTTEAQLMQYLRNWQPAYPPGKFRTYSNPGIGTLGLITAKAVGQNFTALVQQRLFPALGMKNSFIDVPSVRMPYYSQGYTKSDTAIRMSPGMLSSEAYGVKSTAADMIRFVEANMNEVPIAGTWQQAITETHTGYFTAGPMTQDLIWEQYAYPVAQNTLLAGNAPEMILDATPVSEIKPPQEPTGRVWIDKTGSTNGFGAYVAFVPEKRLGIVILANKNFPIVDRVKAAYRILTSIAEVP